MSAACSRIFALNEDCLTLLLKFLRLQDLINFDVCASGDKEQRVAGSSYLNSLQHLENANLMDRKEFPHERAGIKTSCHKWSSQSVVWGGLKNLRCLLSETGFRLGEYNPPAEGEEKGEEKKMKEDRLCARMDLALGVIGTKCKGSSTFYLQGPTITDRGVTALLAAKASICSINIHRCDGITDAALAAVSEHLGDSLTDLSIADCPVSDAGLVQVITGCPNIANLSLNFKIFIHNNHEMIRRFPAPAYHITPATLFAIAQSLPDLSSLNCNCLGFYKLNVDSLIANDAFVAIVEACDLSSLSIQHVAVDDDFLVAIGDNCPNLSDFSFDGNGELETTDVGITALAKGCPDLTYINLTDAKGVTDTGLTALCKHCPKLEGISVPSNISDASLEIVLKACESLYSLNMMECSQLTVASARTLADHGGKLTDLALYVGDIPWLDDASLLVIAAGCKTLDSLSIVCFDADLPVQITNEGLLAAALACKTLTFVGLRGTLVTQEGIDAMKRALPDVRGRFI